jgi:ADP-heptose:LPS heptosyltransferase
MADRPRILMLVMADGIGDATMRLPFLQALRRVYPDHELWWIASTNSVMAGIMRRFTGTMIDRVFEHAHLEKPAREVIPRLRQLPRFDIVFDIRARIATVLTARTFVSHQHFFCCLPGFMLSDRRPPGRWQRPLALPERMLSMLDAAIGGHGDYRGWQSILSPGPEAVAAADRILSPADGRKLVGIAPGSSQSFKNWPMENFVALARKLADDGLTPVFIGGPFERAAIEALPPLAGAISYTPDLRPDIHGLELTMAIARRLHAAVANDSGIGHLFAAAEIPLVSVFGPTDHRKCGPWSDKVRFVLARDFGGTGLGAIPVAAVRDAVDRALG